MSNDSKTKDPLFHMILTTGKAIPFVIVLCQPYSNNPTQSVERAMKIVRILRDKGYTVFSPVLHTHFYDLYWKAEHPDHTDDYYTWDLMIYQSFYRKICLFTYDWQTSKGCRLEMEWAVKNKIPLYVMDKEEEGVINEFVYFKYEKSRS